MKRVTGVVVNNVMDKTIKVHVVRRIRHPMYGKLIKKTTTYFAHDERNVSKIGDRVVISSSRPISKMKRWVLLEE